MAFGFILAAVLGNKTSLIGHHTLLVFDDPHSLPEECEGCVHSEPEFECCHITYKYLWRTNGTNDVNNSSIKFIVWSQLETHILDNKLFYESSLEL